MLNLFLAAEELLTLTQSTLLTLEANLPKNFDVEFCFQIFRHGVTKTTRPYIFLTKEVFGLAFVVF